METFVLVIMLYTAYAKTAITIPGYWTVEECELAGKAAEKKIETIDRSAKFVCVKGPNLAAP